MNKRYDWYLYIPPDVWNVVQAVGLLQGAAAVTPNIWAELSLKEIQAQVEAFIFVHQEFWGEAQHDDHSDD